MEKELLFPWTQNQNPATYCSPDMSFYTTTSNSNWDHSLDQFESALSSMVSSPAASATPASASGGVHLIELIGKLGTISSPTPHSYVPNNIHSADDNSCYTTPINSPPKLNLDQMPAFAADPGFAERAARFSCFGSRSFNGRIGGCQFPDAEMAYNTTPLDVSAKLRRVPTSHFPGSASHLDGVHLQETTTNNNKKLPSDSKEESSVSQKVQSNEAMGRKRKSAPRGKPKAGMETNDSDSKRTKSDENEKGGKSGGHQKQSKDNSKPPEPPKDYIHVRARRGQATDSHSLAERVRREKISERMKFLQDLVPGCNKVTGKAVMLDEIINYVQSLQRQVEFLSMKLATVNPRMDSVHMEALLSKEILQSRTTLYPVESSNSASAAFPYAYQTQDPSCLPNATTDSQFCNNSLNNDHLRQNHHHGLQLPSVNGFCNSATQVSMWEDELHNVVQMGFAAGSMEPSQMKMEP